MDTLARTVTDRRFIVGLLALFSLFITTVIALAFTGGWAAGRTIYVDQSVTANSNNDGTSWETAYGGARGLAIAMENAQPGDTILVAGGTYIPNGTTDVHATFTLKDNVTVKGSYTPNTNTQDATPTILDGAPQGGPVACHVVTSIGAGENSRLENVTIQGGNASAPDCLNAGVKSQNGGGMYIEGGAPELTNVIFQGNNAVHGGAIYMLDSAPTLNNVQFGVAGNATQANNAIGIVAAAPVPEVMGRGGGIYSDNSSPVLENVAFDLNTAHLGGGMYNKGGSPKLEDVRFNGNAANTTTTSNGGGMYNEQSSPTLQEVAFNTNTAANDGGGMYNDRSSPTLQEVAFIGNNATNGNGGGMYNERSDAEVHDSAFDGNTAVAGWGGGMFNDSSSPTIDNDTTFIGNGATNGGGMFNINNSSPVLTDITFGDEDNTNANSATTSGGGMFNANNSNPILTRVTFQQNTANGSGAGMFNDSSSPTITESRFIDNIAGTTAPPAAGQGGGMQNRNSSPQLRNVRFERNIALGAPPVFGQGGGMFNDGSNPEMEAVIFTGNTAGGGNPFTAGQGGGMYNTSSNPQLTNVQFGDGEQDIPGNTATQGGGMFNDRSNPVLNGGTIAGNIATTATGQGGGMFNLSSNPDISDVLFEDNEAAQHGGGMYNAVGSRPNITGNTAFNGNKAGVQANGNGGGMFNAASSPVLADVAFSRNVAGAMTGSSTTGNGGGMFNEQGSSPDLNRVTFENNEAVGDGGGMANDNSTPAIRGCVFRNNTAVRGGGISNIAQSNAFIGEETLFEGNSATGIPTATAPAGLVMGGGGMFNDDSDTQIIDVIFDGNSASGGSGGGMSGVTNSNLAVINVTFSGNKASGNSTLPAGANANRNDAGYGGGLFIGNDSEATVINTVFSGNAASGNGGGMALGTLPAPGGYAQIINSTFSNNNATNSGGGLSGGNPMVRSIASTGGVRSDDTPVIRNSIFWGNQADTRPQIDPANLHVETNLVQDDYQETGLNIITGDPLFLDPDGEDNRIGTPDDNLRLMANRKGGSPAINAGDSTAVISDTWDIDEDGDREEPVPFDRDGNNRFGSTAVGAGSETQPRLAVDMGAYQHGADADPGNRVTPTPTPTRNVIISPIVIYVAEDGVTSTYGIGLSHEPSDPVTINVKTDDQVTASTNELLFTPQNWDVPQRVKIRAVDDTVKEGLHTSAIEHTARSADRDYNSTEVVSVQVQITDNDTPVDATEVPTTTATVTATDVPVTATATDVPPTATATALPPTATPTHVPATATATDVPPTVTATHVPPMATATALPTAEMPPTATATHVPPMATATVLPTAEMPPTATDVPPTALPTEITISPTVVPTTTVEQERLPVWPMPTDPPTDTTRVYEPPVTPPTAPPEPGIQMTPVTPTPVVPTLPPGK